MITQISKPKLVRINNLNDLVNLGHGAVVEHDFDFPHLVVHDRTARGGYNDSRAIIFHGRIDKGHIVTYTTIIDEDFIFIEDGRINMTAPQEDDLYEGSGGMVYLLADRILMRAGL
jgi:hypothetical protein